MKLFEDRGVSAVKYALEGGQALHVFPAIKELKHRAPSPFKRTGEWAHLFDQDKERLVKTAKKLGVRVIKVDREGTPMQHIDLCGGPLRKAKALCTDDEQRAGQRDP